MCCLQLGCLVHDLQQQLCMHPSHLGWNNVGRCMCTCCFLHARSVMCAHFVQPIDCGDPHFMLSAARIMLPTGGFWRMAPPQHCLHGGSVVLGLVTPWCVAWLPARALCSMALRQDVWVTKLQCTPKTCFLLHSHCSCGALRRATLAHQDCSARSAVLVNADTVMGMPQHGTALWMSKTGN